MYFDFLYYRKVLSYTWAQTQWPGRNKTLFKLLVLVPLITALHALGIATGGGQSTNIYAGGVFKLNQDEALIIESRVPVEPSFLGFHLSNLWGESLDFESYQSSLNASQMALGQDGIYRWHVAGLGAR